MRRLVGVLAMLILLGALPGCGDSGAAPQTGPAGDNRAKEIKESDDLMQKQLQEYRKTTGARRR